MAKMVEVGMGMAAQSHKNQQRGAGVKNLGPRAMKQANPAPKVRSLGGMNLKGPDKGAGGS